MNRVLRTAIVATSTVLPTFALFGASSELLDSVPPTIDELRADIEGCAGLLGETAITLTEPPQPCADYTEKTSYNFTVTFIGERSDVQAVILPPKEEFSAEALANLKETEDTRKLIETPVSVAMGLIGGLVGFDTSIRATRKKSAKQSD